MTVQDSMALVILNKSAQQNFKVKEPILYIIIETDVDHHSTDNNVSTMYSNPANEVEIERERGSAYTTL